MLRKLSKFTICAFAFFGMYSTAWSQINVTATAGTATATYTTLKGAFDKINDGTHRGAINISVTANTTETAAAVLNGTGTGSASYTSVVVKPATGATPTITGNIAAAMVDLNGASNVTIDGSNVAGGTTKNLSIINTSTNSAAAAIRFINGASNDTVKNSVIKGSAAGTTYSLAVACAIISVSTSTAAAGNNNITLDNNTIESASSSNRALKAIFVLGSAGKPNSNLLINNNKIVDFKEFGVCLANYAANVTLNQNEIYQVTNSSVFIYGIYCSGTEVENLNITKNYIHDLKNTTTPVILLGFLLSGDSETCGILITNLKNNSTLHMSNNMISLASLSSNTAGPLIMVACQEQLNNTCTVEVFNNSFNIYGNASSIYIESHAFSTSGNANASVQNNIFRNSRAGGTTNYQISYGNFIARSSLVSNYNNISNVAGSSVAGYWVGTFLPTLANWQTTSTRDANSLSVVPYFFSNTDLHLQDSNNCALYGRGTPLAAITTDIDNDTRNTPPAIGADEYTNTFSVTPGPDQTICNSVTTATISASNTRGTGVWTLVSGSGNIVTPNSSTTDVTNISNGLNIFQWTVTSGTCKDSVRVEVKYGTTDPVVTLEAIPNGPVCAEDTIYFIATVTPSATNNYVWRKNNVVFGGSTQQIPATNFANGDQITVTVTVTGNQCISTTPQTSAPYTVSVLPAPVINVVPNQGSICKGDSILLTASGADTYQWLQDGATILNATSNTYKAHLAGAYTVIGKAQCYGRSNPVNIQIIQSPTPTIVANGEYVATDVIYESYQWYFNGNPIPGANSYLLQATQTGNYSVCVTLNGCLACTEVKRVSVGINDIDLNGLTVYPNPASDKVYIRSAENVNVVLAGLDGKEVMKENNARELSIGHLSKGVYIMRIYNSRNTLIGIQKIIKS